MQLFWQAFIIMTLGMGTVFVVLFLVIQGIHLSAALVRRFGGESEADEAAAAGGAAVGPEGGRRLAAAVAVALTVHGRSRRRQGR